MDVILLFFTRLIVYSLGGFIAYKKRLWWLVAVCAEFSVIAFLFTFYRQDTKHIVAILSNLGGLLLVMTALKATTHKPIIKTDTLIAGQIVNHRIIPKGK